MMAAQTGSSIQTQSKNGATSQRSKPDDVELPQLPVYRVVQNSSRRKSIATVLRIQRPVWSTFWQPWDRFFVKDNQAIFLYRFFQMLRCTREQTDYQRRLTRRMRPGWILLRQGQQLITQDVVAEVDRQWPPSASRAGTPTSWSPADLCWSSSRSAGIDQ